jgi:MoxR-like ATPase
LAARRCLYHWIDYPDAARELDILRRKAPQAAAELARQVVAFVQRVRTLDLYKNPGIAESIDWCNAIATLDRNTLDARTVDATLGALLKYQDDIERVRGPQAASILEQIPAGVAA